MGEAIYAAFFGAGFFMAVAADWFLKLALPLAELEAERRLNRQLAADLDDMIAGAKRADAAYKESLMGHFRACTCGAAHRISFPPPPAPGFAARRKREARDA